MFSSELFRHLSYGVLSNVPIGGAGGTGIEVINYPAIISHTNLGLTELHKRFPLRKSEVIVQLFDEIQTYELHPKYAETNPTEVYKKYIMDSVYHPFTGGVLKIEEIYNECGEELFVNDANQLFSVFTCGHSTIQVPYPEKENSLSVFYRANHNLIDPMLTDPEEVEVNIPMTVLEPLLLFIAARVHNSLPSMDGVNDGNTYMAKFEAAVQRISMLGLINNSNTTNMKLPCAGWK